MRVGLALVGALFATPLLGCGSGAPPLSAQLGEALIRTVDEPGFTTVDRASGPMPLDSAVAATTLSRDVLHDYLDDVGYDGGHARVLRRDDEFVTLLVYDLADDEAAEGLVDLVADRLERSVAYRAFDDPAVPGSRGFTLTSDVAGEVRFCVGEWFAHRARAYGVTRCAPFVLSVPAVTGIALAQHRLATEEDGR